MADLKADLVRLQKELHDFEQKKIEGEIPFHIQRIEQQLARMKGLIDSKETPAGSPKRNDLHGHHDEIASSLEQINQILRDFEDLVDSVRMTAEDVEQEEKENQQNKQASLSQTLRELGNSLLIQK
jgi:hypothetical protein